MLELSIIENGAGWYVFFNTSVNYGYVNVSNIFEMVYIADIWQSIISLTFTFLFWNKLI